MNAHNKLWRWIALALTVTGIIVNYIVASGNKLGVITDKYDSMFVPAGYAFAIWGFIYTSVILYLVLALFTKFGSAPGHEELAKLLSLLAIGGIVWILLYTNYKLAASAVCIGGMLVIAMLALKTGYLKIINNNLPRATIIPFSAYAAWLMVASISNFSLLFKSREWFGNILTEPIWATIMLIISTILGIAISIRFKSVMFAAVVAWATVAIYMKQENNDVRTAALSVSLVLLVFIIIYLFKTAKGSFHAHRP